MSFVSGFEKVALDMSALKTVGSTVVNAAKKSSFQQVVGRAAMKGAVGGAAAGAVSGAMAKDQNGQRGGLGGALSGAVKGGVVGGVAGAAMPAGKLALNKYNRMNKTPAVPPTT